MKKLRLIIVVIVITIISIMFSMNIKADMQKEKQSLSGKVYNFLEDVGNQKKVYSAAMELNHGSSENTCVYFICEVLRLNNFTVPTDTANISQLIPLLEKKGYKKESEYKNLKSGDICFTTDSNGDKNGVPTHTYVFMKWVKEGNYDYAYVCDNQAKDYKNKVYHIRNIKIKDKYNGFNKDAFAFFMK
jgi:hypothetical protein